MPRIRHWFPVTHDINADPEMWELRDKFGDRAGFVWLEILSITDRNDGLLGHDLDQIRNHLASKCRSTRKRVQLILDWCRTRLWLVSDSPPTRLGPASDSGRTRLGLVFDSGLWTRNYAEYHHTRDAKRNGAASPPIRSYPFPPSEEKKEKNEDEEGKSEGGKHLDRSVKPKQPTEQQTNQEAERIERKRLMKEAGLKDQDEPEDEE